MRVIRFVDSDEKPRCAALTDDGQVYPLPYQEFMELIREADRLKTTPLTLVKRMISDVEPLAQSLEQLRLLVPIVAPEIWACGVTYEKSKEARNYEATAGKLDVTTFYDKVYDAWRPEIFFKSTSARTVGPDAPLSLRSDSNWQIPEPELGLVLDQHGTIVGYTIGNDMSCRDIEGENPLYLPQAKIWKDSCSIGPAIRLAETVPDPYSLEIICRIYRDQQQVVEGSASTRQLKRRLDELVSFLIQDNQIFDGTVLLTGTSIVPPNDFTLADGDRIEIQIPGIGILRNPVRALRKTMTALS
ncbi:fumarylacetoacetate hydrolase family protein [Brevibacillus humidisoli]|uniref:fumarylacetoacetate hydrolase family protein n=1 Tax=Brevibacillus humidisoli TaxID=2895522 RepID=UPI001E510F31|nr:fumarylacetoacetate hydrolase family protein [Brevibacillus humidisoli]UFJ41390.1 fumarylacetoacetate hydrolase family protein [Brevibacillus humidisoli]